MSKFKLPRGTRDFLPEETAVQNRVREVFIRTTKSYGFQEVRTPIFEHVELLSARSGPEIKGSMLTFHCDHEEYALRPEMTAPVCRLMSSGAFSGDQAPHKLSYFGPCFRYTRPNSERYQEFLQAGIEVLDATGPGVDAEIIATSASVLKSLGIVDFTLRVGNLGIFRHLMPDNLNAEDRATVIGHLDKLNAIDEKCRLLGERYDDRILADLRAERMELAALQAQIDYEGPYVISSKPQLEPTEYAERLGPEAEATFRCLWAVEEIIPLQTAEILIQTSRLRGPIHVVRDEARKILGNTRATKALEELLSLCDTVAVYGLKNVEVVLGIARGFTFYTSTVFEITSVGTDEKVLYCGGGRYDSLVELFGGPATPSTGCAFRFDALVDAFLQSEPWKTSQPFQIFLLAESTKMLDEAIRFAELLRKGGLRIGVGAGELTASIAEDLDKYKTEAIGRIINKNSVQLIDQLGTKNVPLDATSIIASFAISDQT